MDRQGFRLVQVASNLNEAIEYIEEIKTAFQFTQPEMIVVFYHALRIYRDHRTLASKRAALLLWVSFLDINYLDLLVKFKRFVPAELQHLVNCRIVYLGLQSWMRTSMEVEWSQEWTEIWDLTRSDSMI
ncbi:hypothetical protein EAF04_005382 [Stromatinia cepivora]|nr:hypothetical protein EAF04_005382 [Stromatinia cepivora]